MSRDFVVVVDEAEEVLSVIFIFNINSYTRISDGPLLPPPTVASVGVLLVIAVTGMDTMATL